MATLVLPARSDVPFYDFEITLEGRSYTLELRWNARASGWFFSLYDAAGNPLVSGRRVTLGVNLCGPVYAPGTLPPGSIFAIDTGPDDADPGSSDFGSRVLLVYVESTGA